MIWGENAGGNASGPGIMLNASNGNANCFWDDSIKPPAPLKVNVQQNGSGKPLAKSQTVSNIQSSASIIIVAPTNPINVAPSTLVAANNNGAKSTQSSKIALTKTSSSGNVVATNTNAITSAGNVNAKKAKGNQAVSKKGGSNTDESNNDEFNTWCFKALTTHVDVIDGDYLKSNLIYELQK